MRKAFVTAIFWILLKVLTRFRIYGQENIPAEGPLIVAPNHMSRADTPILLLNGVRKDISALVADKYTSRPFFRFIVNSLKGIWIDRSKADFSAFRDAINHLKDGGALGIAPEGTRSKTGQLIEGKPGVLILTGKSNAPIIPVAITGTDTVMKDILKFKRPIVTATYGKPFTLPPLERENREESLRKNTDEVMCRIAALLPEKYHGYYAGHPRLKELLEEQKP